MTLAAHGCDGLHHVVALLLAATVGAQPLLGQLQRTLERGSGANLQQLDHAALIGREAHNLADHLADEGHTSALLALAVGRLWLQLPSGHDEALVQAGSKAGGRRLLVSRLGHVAPSASAYHPQDPGTSQNTAATCCGCLYKQH